MTRILIIDDDKAVGTAIKVLLENEGSEVVHAENGRCGLETVKRDEFDVVIVDIFMPGLDGIETIKLLRAVRPDLSIIAISGFLFRDARTPAPDFLGMATELGATCSLRKPFKPRELVDAIETCLAAQSKASSPKPARI